MKDATGNVPVSQRIFTSATTCGSVFVMLLVP